MNEIMKGLVIGFAMGVAFIAIVYIGGCISSLEESTERHAKELYGKLDDLNENIEAIMQDTDEIKGLVNGRIKKYVNRIDL